MKGAIGTRPVKAAKPASVAKPNIGSHPTGTQTVEGAGAVKGGNDPVTIPAVAKTLGVSPEVVAKRLTAMDAFDFLYRIEEKLRHILKSTDWASGGESDLVACCNQCKSIARLAADADSLIGGGK